MAERSFRWDPRTSRYRDTSTGRFVAERDMRTALDTFTDNATARLKGHAQSLLDGRTTLAEFQQALMQETKQAHLAAAMAARGGKAQMSQADYGFVGRIIRDNYDRARAFAQDIASGKQPLDGRLVNRASLYGEVNRTFEAVRARDARNSGMSLEERNRLDPAADHCKQEPSCRGESQRGWVPLGELVPVGNRSCKARCRCRIVRRVVEAA